MIGPMNELLELLGRLGGKVSTVELSTGVLSVTGVFQGDVRLYVEVDPDGSVGVVLSRSPSHAEELQVTGISDLTESFVLAAVGAGPGREDVSACG